MKERRKEICPKKEKADRIKRQEARGKDKDENEMRKTANSKYVIARKEKREAEVTAPAVSQHITSSPAGWQNWHTASADSSSQP